MPWVTGISQVGLQGVGSARREEYDLALQNGNRLITAREIHEQGVETILKQIPSAANYYITIDADALDPSIAPGVYYPSPDGLGFTQITDLLKGIARRGRIVGLDYCAFVPELDLRNLTAIFAARLLLNLIGTLAYAGQIG
jgi:agmatinase